MSGPAGISAPISSDVPVTRHFSLMGETNRPKLALVDAGETPAVWSHRPVTKTQLVGFCDWLSIYQRHGEGLPKVADGAVLRIDRDGVTESITLKKSRIEGSHETAVFVRCDGETVWFDGNVSKLGRPDNVFGYSFSQCLQIINGVLADLGLPPFTEGQSYISNCKGEPRTIWTGAIVTRVDVTQNHCTGSKEDAYHFMRFLQAQQASRLKTGTYGDGETVDFGRGSRRLYFKAYLKGPELRRHITREVKASCALTPPSAPSGKSLEEFMAWKFEMAAWMGKPPPDAYVLQLADWCDLVGLVRVEMTFKATMLHSMNCHYLGAFDMKQLEIEFEKRSEILTRASADIEELTEMPKAILSTYRMWQAGDDVTSKMSRATFYRHRLALIPYGVDIAIKSNVVPMRTKTRIIKLGPVSMPEWYELPEIERKRYGTNGY